MFENMFTYCMSSYCSEHFYILDDKAVFRNWFHLLDVELYFRNWFYALDDKYVLKLFSDIGYKGSKF